MRDYKSTSLLTILNLYLFKDDAHLCSMRSIFCVGVGDIYEATCDVVSSLLSVFAHSVFLFLFFRLLLPGMLFTFWLHSLSTLFYRFCLFCAFGITLSVPEWSSSAFTAEFQHSHKNSSQERSLSLLTASIISELDVCRFVICISITRSAFCSLSCFHVVYAALTEGKLPAVKSLSWVSFKVLMQSLSLWVAASWKHWRAAAQQQQTPSPT